MLSLLSHENTDIAASALALLQELADPDVLAGADEEEAGDADADAGDGDGGAAARVRGARAAGYEALLAALAAEGLPALLVGLALRLEESAAGGGAAAAAADGAALERVLALVCLLLGDGEAGAAGAAAAAARFAQPLARAPADGHAGGGDGGLLRPLLRALRGRDFSPLKGAAAETLALLLQVDAGDLVVARALGDARLAVASGASGGGGGGGSGAAASVDGVEALLEALNVYKRRQPESSEEKECVENAFDALCSAMVSCVGDAMRPRLHRAARHRQRRLMRPLPPLLPSPRSCCRPTKTASSPPKATRCSCAWPRTRATRATPRCARCPLPWPTRPRAAPRSSTRAG